MRCKFSVPMHENQISKTYRPKTNMRDEVSPLATSQLGLPGKRGCEQ